VCERVLIISAGEIVADGKPETLAGDTLTERKLVIRVAGPKDSVLSLLRSRDGVKSAEPVGEVEERSCDFLVESRPNVDVRKPLFTALAAAGWPILMLRPELASLEDVFIKLTEDGGAR
jgi:ABC-2 type transport system ATP-binding protein